LQQTTPTLTANLCTNTVQLDLAVLLDKLQALTGLNLESPKGFALADADVSDHAPDHAPKAGSPGTLCTAADQSRVAHV